MAKKSPRRTSAPKHRSPPTGSAKHSPDVAEANMVRVAPVAGETAWKLVHPRCAQERELDLDEVRGMIDAGELEVARDECRWLLQGCSDCIDAHRLLGEMALEANDVPLARGHFGYAYRIGTLALERAAVEGPLPYRIVSNQSFLESAKGLVWCLVRQGKREMALEVVAQVLKCDPEDALNVRSLLDDAAPAAESGEN